MFALIKNAFNILFAWKQTSGEGKKPWKSNTIWAMAISWAALAASKYAGVEIGPEEQTAIIAFIGVVMRLISKDPVGFYEDKR